jgi:hypothetical protein
VSESSWRFKSSHPHEAKTPWLEGVFLFLRVWHAGPQMAQTVSVPSIQEAPDVFLAVRDEVAIRGIEQGNRGTHDAGEQKEAHAVPECP